MKSNFFRHTEQYASIRKNRWCMLKRKVKVNFTIEQTTKAQRGVEV